MFKHVSEIFNELEAASTSEREKILAENRNNRELYETLSLIYNDRVKFHFDQLPEYKPLDCPVDMGLLNYQEALRRVYLFIKNHPSAPRALTEERRKVLLIQILESLSAEDARIYGNMIMKTTGSRKINKTLVKKVFPDMIKES